jgi:pimeloyl-ACP methyl ester carboxylesterase
MSMAIFIVYSPRTVTEASGYGPSGRSAWLDIDWRQHQRWVRVQDRWANIVEYGEGKPILFVHGLGGSWQNWLENIPAVAQAGHRAIGVDLPGFGASEMPAEKISISGYGRFIDALLGELDVGPVALVGNSMGGFVGAEVAIRFPERLEQLVLVSAAGISVEHDRNEPVLAALYRTDRLATMAVAGLAARADVVSRRPRLRKALMYVVAAHPDRLPAALVAEQVRGAGKQGFLPALDALTDYPIRDHLGQIAAPTLIVWGSDDRLVPVRDAGVFDELIPDSRKVVFDDTGHVAMLERPARFNRLLLDFLGEKPGEEVDETSEAAVGD